MGVNNAQLDSFAARTAESIAKLDPSSIGDDVDLTIEQIITEGGENVGHYHLILKSGAANVFPGGAANPDVTIKQDAETARALRDGSLHAQGAFLTGKLSVDGDIDKLLQHGPLLSGLLSGK